MDKPIDWSTLSTEVGKRVIDKPELPPGGVATDKDVTTEMVEGSLQLKRGTAGAFEVFCDEGKTIGGGEKYPTPMMYMAMGVGF